MLTVGLTAEDGVESDGTFPTDGAGVPDGGEVTLSLGERDDPDEREGLTVVVVVVVVIVVVVDSVSVDTVSEDEE
jgi:hypothetical protein